MVAHFLAMAPAERLIFEVLTRSAPLFPLPLVLALEQLALSRLDFSFWGCVAFRAAYLLCLVLAVYLTYVLAMMFWE